MIARSHTSFHLDLSGFTHQKTCPAAGEIMLISGLSRKFHRVTLPLACVLTQSNTALPKECHDTRTRFAQTIFRAEISFALAASPRLASALPEYTRKSQSRSPLP